MPACQLPSRTRHNALVQQRKVIRLALGTVVAAGCTEAAHRAPAARVQHPRQAFLQAVNDDAALPRLQCAPDDETDVLWPPDCQNIGVVKLKLFSTAVRGR